VLSTPGRRDSNRSSRIRPELVGEDGYLEAGSH
jgi:hypothetical protein